MKYYGSLTNRFEEGKQFCEEIKVGTGVTEYHYSDRTAYEVIAVKDQKHITIREYDAKHIGDAFENKWELVSNEENPTYNLTKRGAYWYTETECTIADLEEYEEARKNRNNINLQLWFAHNNFDAETIRKRGSQKRYNKMNISVGVADYYYDYEF